ncbi:hypothetical protein BDW22DRAFT_1428784 [Trametopsis cervina]|nr:hypothetical protein BDW22DRAFT_1428784 [Trametopsis cervina]
MNATRRDSILDLFDPLNRPETPSRCSTDSSSDKENDNPIPGQFTAFFNRVYTTSKPTQPPLGKLIDYLDASGSHSFSREVSDSDEELEHDEEGCAGATEEQSEMRLPLGEIALERVPPSETGIELSLSSENPLQTDEPLHADTEDKAVSPFNFATTAPSGSPLADVINSINIFGSVSLDGAADAIVRETADVYNGPSTSIPYPDITVCPPEDEHHLSTAGNEQATPAQPHSPYLSPTASGSTRRSSITTSAYDPRRASVDLQSSFSMHLQSTDMSFDLLKDSISFLGQPQDNSFWPSISEGDIEDDTLDFAQDQLRLRDAAERFLTPAKARVDEDTFDFTKEKQKIEALAEKYGSIHEEKLQVAEAVAQAAVANSPRQRSKSEAPLPVFSPTAKASTPKEAKEVSAGTRRPSAVLPNIFSLAQKQAAEPPRVVKPRRSSIAAPTIPSSLSHVPALRIMKKTFKFDHQRSESSTSSASSRDNGSSASGTSNRAESETHNPAPSVPQRSSHILGKPVQPVKGVQRPPIGSTLPPIGSTLPPTFTLGPRRPSLQRPAAEQPAPVKRSVTSRPVAASSIAPPSTRLSGSRVAPRDSTAASNAKPQVSNTALPVRSASSLPKPASKLPAPSRTFGFSARSSGPTRRAA